MSLTSSHGRHALFARLLALGLLLSGGAARAEINVGGAPAPVIREIAFEGNDVTKPQTMLREIVIQVGDEADDGLIEYSRQAIQDLGLFRNVAVRKDEVRDGVRVVFTVKEKWYILPYPRISANTDGQYGYGGEVRWANLWGLNHKLRLLGSMNNNKDAGRGTSANMLASYDAPFLFDTPYSWNFLASHVSTPVTEPTQYTETLSTAQVLITRALSDDASRPASQGWRAGGGLLWQDESTHGAGAIAPYGASLALVGLASYRDKHNKIYSEDGTSFDVRYEIADKKFGSDYSYSRLGMSYLYQMPVGDLPHEDLELGVQVGSTNHPPGHEPDYGLGGTLGLRGYHRNFVQGNFYYLVSAQYLHPTWWNGVRVVAGIEAGNAYDEFDSFNDSLYTSLNLGLRLRFPQLVSFEFELGMAVPLTGGGKRVYANRINF